MQKAPSAGAAGAVWRVDLTKSLLLRLGRIALLFRARLGRAMLRLLGLRLGAVSGNGSVAGLLRGRLLCGSLFRGSLLGRRSLLRACCAECYGSDRECNEHVTVVHDSSSCLMRLGRRT